MSTFKVLEAEKIKSAALKQKRRTVFILSIFKEFCEAKVTNKNATETIHQEVPHSDITVNNLRQTQLKKYINLNLE